MPLCQQQLLTDDATLKTHKFQAVDESKINQIQVSTCPTKNVINVQWNFKIIFNLVSMLIVLITMQTQVFIEKCGVTKCFQKK